MSAQPFRGRSGQACSIQMLGEACPIDTNPLCLHLQRREVQATGEPQADAAEMAPACPGCLSRFGAGEARDLICCWAGPPRAVEGGAGIRGRDHQAAGRPVADRQGRPCPCRSFIPPYFCCAIRHGSRDPPEVAPPGQYLQEVRRRLDRFCRCASDPTRQWPLICGSVEHFRPLHSDGTAPSPHNGVSPAAQGGQAPRQAGPITLATTRFIRRRRPASGRGGHLGGQRAPGGGSVDDQ